MARYVIRPDATGFSIIDMWAGEPAVVAATRQVGLPQTDADHIAELLNQRASEALPASPPAS